MCASNAVLLHRIRIVAGSLAIALPLLGTAADNVPPETLDVKVFADRYVAAGKPFTDLAALEAWAKPIVLRGVRLDACGQASSKQLVAAIERFQSAYAAGIEVRALSAQDARCAASVAAPTRADAEYLATDELGRSRLP